MRALCWKGVNDLQVETVPDPTILNDHDVILKVGLTRPAARTCTCSAATSRRCARATCSATSSWARSSRSGRAVTKHKVGDRVVVLSFIGCGQCWYCTHELWSLCDNGNPNPGMTEALWGQSTGGCFGYSHALGGYAGSHAEYIRVPFADHGAFTVPDGVTDERALFASDAAPTGWMGADLGGVQPGDVVAVWGAAGSGRWRARGDAHGRRAGRRDRPASTTGSQQVARARRARRRSTTSETDVLARAARDDRRPGPGRVHRGRRHGGARHRPAVRLRPASSSSCGCRPTRPTAVREAICACRKGGTRVRARRLRRLVDKFPLGALMNKGLTAARRAAARPALHPADPRPHAPGRARDRAPRDPRDVARRGPKGYEMFKDKQDGCVRAVFRP